MNPVLPGMHPDPTVCRVGRDYYLACSSFEYFPGVPIFHSRDLVRWRQLGHVLTRQSQLDLSACPSSGGIYAPTLRHHDGTFHLVTTLVGRGHFLVTADDPRGPWSDPVWLDDDGIDPSLAFLDGQVYYTRNGRGSDPDHPYVYQGELGQSLRMIWKGTGGIWPEAPHLYRRGEWHYLVTAEGGTSYDHSVVVARSRDPYGPFEPSPHGPLATSRDRPRYPIQALGHADLVEHEDGSWSAVLLGIRPVRGRHHHLGRETFVAPVDWGDDGWPRMQLPEVHEPEAVPDEAWVSVRNPVPGSRDGLRLWGQPATLSDVASPAVLCRPQQRFEMTFRAQVGFAPEHDNEEAGICVRANEAYHFALLVGRTETRLVRTTRGRSTTIARRPRGTTLEVRATRDRYVFAADGEELGAVSTRLISAETIYAATGRHHFTGAMIGLYATGNGARSATPADFTVTLAP